MLIAASPNATPASSQANLPIVVESINGTLGDGDVVSPEQVKAEERPIQTIATTQAEAEVAAAQAVTTHTAPPPQQLDWTGEGD